MSYDSKDDVFYVHAESLDHQISAPNEIYIIESGSAVAALGVKDGDGHMHVIRLRDPLMIGARIEQKFRIDFAEGQMSQGPL